MKTIKLCSFDFDSFFFGLKNEITTNQLEIGERFFIVSDFGGKEARKVTAIRVGDRGRIAITSALNGGWSN